MTELSEKLRSVIGTPVSIELLKGLSEKQINYLHYQCKIVKHAIDMKKGTNYDFWKDDREDALKEIKSVLDSSKKPRQHSDQTSFYLKEKKLIN